MCKVEKEEWSVGPWHLAFRLLWWSCANVFNHFQRNDKLRSARRRSELLSSARVLRRQHGRNIKQAWGRWWVCFVSYFPPTKI
jgi:hypothetical protein